MFEPILHELITLSVCGTLDEEDLMKVCSFRNVMLKNMFLDIGKRTGNGFVIRTKIEICLSPYMSGSTKVGK
jgi:hypothetical protein